MSASGERAIRWFTRPEDLRLLGAQPRALIFVHHNWSAPSVQGLKRYQAAFDLWQELADPACVWTWNVLDLSEADRAFEEAANHWIRQIQPVPESLMVRFWDEAGSRADLAVGSGSGRVLLLREGRLVRFFLHASLTSVAGLLDVARLSFHVPDRF